MSTAIQVVFAKLGNAKYALMNDFDGVKVVGPGRYRNQEDAESARKALSRKFGKDFEIIIAAKTK